MTLEEKAIKKALNLGATEAEAYVKRSKVTRVDFASEIQNIKQVETIGMGLRVAVGKKLAINTTTILKESDVDALAKKAVKIAKASPEDPNWQSLNKTFNKSSVQGTYDKELSKISFEKIVDSLQGGIQRASENDRKVIVTRGLLQASDSQTTIMNNYQESVNRKDTKVNLYFMTKATEGGTGTGAESQQVRTWDALDFDKVADTAANKALKYQNAKPISSGKMPVIFVNKFSAQMLGLMIAPNINSSWVLKGRSSFGQKIGEQVAHTEISVHDTALMKGGYESRIFDDEGHPTQKTPIIEGGVLKHLLFDSYYANRADTQSTGNAFRNYDSIPSPSANNLVLEPGHLTLDDMITDTKNGLVVEDTIGHWLSKPTSGELSATVTHGMLVRNGELTKPVGNIVIASNYFDILLNKIEGLGKDTINSGKYYSPSIKISEMTIAGK